MPKGFSDYVFKAKKQTDAKIVAALFVEPYRYNQLQEQTKIQRKRLKDGLQELTTDLEGLGVSTLIFASFATIAFRNVER